ncbi:ROK family transcriptional regulator [Brachybacterium sp. MASK1Z-5]|uniref:ROK family transcriptional regulator n=1 Tax=Brachybacterium halotolerans TaxID=2795215 RepID=A0ABS1B858_9MICO|nr:ROK family transcriptional regulator [Brachybacterium halotolerans]MBK0330834.1 ROK family transcriptional regulator [Brachybacterium halotolerans]
MSTTGSLPTPAHPREAEVIDAFRGGGTLTRALIAESTGLSRSTVSAVLTGLVEEGAVEVVGHDEQPGRGRPTERVAIDRTAVRAIGIDLAHGAVRIVHLNTLGEVLASREQTHDESLGAARRRQLVLRMLAELDAAKGADGADAADAADAAGGADGPEAAGAADGSGEPAGPVEPGRSTRRTALRGVGLGISGPAALTRPERAPWHGLVEALEARYGVPVHVDNTTRCAAFAEHLAAGDGHRITLHVRCYQGVGGGVVRDGALDLGADGMAGEIGHLPVEIPGMACRCGRSGCLETVASTPAVLAALRSHGVVLRSPSALRDALAENAPQLRGVLDRVARAIARALVLATTIVDPDEVILTGDLFDADDRLLETIRPLVAESVGERFPLIPLERGRLDAFAGATGAALVVLHPRT